MFCCLNKIKIAFKASIYDSQQSVGKTTQNNQPTNKTKQKKKPVE